MPLRKKINTVRPPACIGDLTTAERAKVIVP